MDLYKPVDVDVEDSEDEEDGTMMDARLGMENVPNNIAVN